MSIKRNFNIPATTLSSGDFIKKGEFLRKRNVLIKFLYIFPPAILVYCSLGGLGPVWQTATAPYLNLVPVFQIIAFFHFFGNGNLFNGITDLLKILNGEVKTSEQSFGERFMENIGPFMANIALFGALLVFAYIAMSFVCNLAVVTRFLKQYHLLYEDASGAAVFGYWYTYGFINLILAFSAATITWLLPEPLDR